MLFDTVVHKCQFPHHTVAPHRTPESLSSKVTNASVNHREDFSQAWQDIIPIKIDISFVGISSGTTVFERMSVGILGQDGMCNQGNDLRNV